jgi:hypothetical protein
LNIRGSQHCKHFRALSLTVLFGYQRLGSSRRGFLHLRRLGPASLSSSPSDDWNSSADAWRVHHLHLWSLIIALDGLIDGWTSISNELYLVSAAEQIAGVESEHDTSLNCSPFRSLNPDEFNAYESLF